MKTKLFTLFFICIATISMAQVNEQDSLALVALYDSTDGPNWTCGCNEGWLTEPVEHWQGVTLSEGRVVALNLSMGYMSCGSCGLNGTIPLEVGNLTQLENIDLSNNINIIGTIPHEISLISHLKRMKIINCSLSGAIPSEIGNLLQLEEIWLYNNELSGTIPSSIGQISNLKYLLLNDNCITGEIPVEIGNLLNLTNIELSNNILEGEIPASISYLNQLYSLELSFNNLEGNVPDIFSDMHQIQRILLNHNYFTDIPEFNNLESLQRLKIENNQLTFEDLEPNQALASIDEYTYSPQDSINIEIDTMVIIHSSIILETICGGENNQYQWYFNNNPIEGATESTYTLDNVIAANQGAYTCAVTNTVVTGLTLWRHSVTLNVNTSGIEDTNNESIIIEKSGNNLTITNLHDNCNINVYTVEGRLLHSCVGEKDRTAIIDVSKFTKGVLILKIVNENGTFISKKIINY